MSPWNREGVVQKKMEVEVQSAVVFTLGLFLPSASALFFYSPTKLDKKDSPAKHFECIALVDNSPWKLIHN